MTARRTITRYGGEQHNASEFLVSAECAVLSSVLVLVSSSVPGGLSLQVGWHEEVQDAVGWRDLAGGTLCRWKYQ